MLRAAPGGCARTQGPIRRAVDADDERLQLFAGETLFDDLRDAVAARGSGRGLPVDDHTGDGDDADRAIILLFDNFLHIGGKLDVLVAADGPVVLAAKLRQPLFEGLAVRELVDQSWH